MSDPETTAIAPPQEYNWPPSQGTRDAVINCLSETLSTESVLSKRFGILPQAEAEKIARHTEDEVFSVAAAGSALLDYDDLIETLRMYSKQISKLLVDTLISRAGSVTSVDGNAVEMQSSRQAPTTASEDIPAAGNAEA